ncbi:MAG TPA: NAD(P)H-dependent oxidoreductase [Bacteroidales bacterium]|nr:NAD(P)H-dependent oxidoreductase [Bacteroidales bacterium]
MKNKILILFAHPRYERSLNQSELINRIPDIPEITFHDLYEKYPEFDVDIETEQKLLLEHQIIIWQHPFYWYSSPPLLKQWIDLVLSFGWAYGTGGNALQGKMVFNAITAGGQRSAYSTEGHNRFSINQLLAPFEQTAYLCKMIWVPPFVIHGTHRISSDDRQNNSLLYGKILNKLAAGDFRTDELFSYSYLNDWIEDITVKE